MARGQRSSQPAASLTEGSRVPRVSEPLREVPLGSCRWSGPGESIATGPTVTRLGRFSVVRLLRVSHFEIGHVHLRKVAAGPDSAVAHAHTHTSFTWSAGGFSHDPGKELSYSGGDDKELWPGA
jgi:hypothetical protein